MVFSRDLISHAPGGQKLFGTAVLKGKYYLMGDFFSPPSLNIILNIWLFLEFLWFGTIPLYNHIGQFNQNGKHRKSAKLPWSHKCLEDLKSRKFTLWVKMSIRHVALTDHHHKLKTNNVPRLLHAVTSGCPSYAVSKSNFYIWRSWTEFQSLHATLTSANNFRFKSTKL